MNADVIVVRETSRPHNLEHLALLLIVALTGLMASAAAQRPPRKITHNGTPLAERLLPGDETVVVESLPEEVGVFVSPQISFKDAVRWATRMSESILLGVSEKTDVRLTNHDTWLASYSALRVTDVLKIPDDRAFGPGDILELYEGGGEMAINGVRVIAGPADRKPFTPGRRYLVFTGLSVGHPYEIPEATYEILPDGKLAAMLIAKPRTDWRQVLSGRSLNDVLRLVREFPEWLKRHDPD